RVACTHHSPSTVIDPLVSPAELGTTVLRARHEILTDSVHLIESLLPRAGALGDQPLPIARVPELCSHLHPPGVEQRDFRVRDAVIAEGGHSPDMSPPRPNLAIYVRVRSGQRCERISLDPCQVGWECGSCNRH